VNDMWQDILKFSNRTDKEMQDELQVLFHLMGKYLDVDDGLYGPSNSIAILFKNAIDTLKNPALDEEYTYNFKFLSRLIDETSEAQIDADNEGDREKEAHYESIESRLQAIYSVLKMREKLNMDEGE
tara:strand:+ start:1088 stop:1468 length:381 start_codon:yes stop_codon:yes gene_type:complete